MAESKAEPKTECTALLSSRTSDKTSKTRANYDRLACCYDSWASWERPYVDAGFALLDMQVGETYRGLCYKWVKVFPFPTSHNSRKYSEAHYTYTGSIKN